MMNLIWKLQYELFKPDNGLSKTEIQQIERHWKLLKLVTEDIFDSRNRSSTSEKVGNI